MKSDNAGDSVIMFLVGFAFGAGVALLAAPQSGKRTRRDIARRAEDAQDYLDEVGQELIDRGRELVDRGRNVAEEKIATVRS